MSNGKPGMSIRLTLICHGVTRATRDAAFPLDEPLDALGAANVSKAAASVRRVDTAWTSPALRAMQTATALNLAATIAVELRDIDLGRWAGRSMADVAAAEPDEFAAWVGDAGAAPHGGESVRDLLQRGEAWLNALDRDAGRVVAVTHSSVIRAAVIAVLGARPDAFWRIDAAPLCRVSLQGNRGAWTLRSVGALSPETGTPDDPDAYRRRPE
jgi:broad specificity phosphatase PhoE